MRSCEQRGGLAHKECAPVAVGAFYMTFLFPQPQRILGVVMTSHRRVRRSHWPVQTWILAEAQEVGWIIRLLIPALLPLLLIFFSSVTDFSSEAIEILKIIRGFWWDLAPKWLCLRSRQAPFLPHRKILEPRDDAAWCNSWVGNDIFETRSFGLK